MLVTMVGLDAGCGGPAYDGVGGAPVGGGNDELFVTSIGEVLCCTVADIEGDVLILRVPADTILPRRIRMNHNVAT